MNKRIIRTGMVLISYIAALVLIVVYFKEILKGFSIFLGYSAPFIIGLIIAFFLNPPYRLFMKLFNDKLKLPELLARFISTILVLIFTYGIITGIVMIVAPQVASNFKNFFNHFDQYLQTLQSKLDSLTNRFNIESFDLNGIVVLIKNMGNRIQSSVTEWGPKAINYTTKIISSITTIIISIIFSIYILNARDRLLRQLNRLSKAIFSKKVHKVLNHIGTVMLNTFDDYVVGQCLEAMILGALCFLSMKALRFDYPGMISVVVAVTALVPIVGTIIGGAVGFVLYLLIDPIRALIFLVFFTVLQQLENNLIYPKVVGTKLGLPSLWVLFAVMIGSRVGGFLGMLCGVPVFTIIYTLLRDLTVYKEDEKRQRAYSLIEKRRKLEQEKLHRDKNEVSIKPAVNINTENIDNMSAIKKNSDTNNESPEEDTARSDMLKEIYRGNDSGNGYAQIIDENKAMQPLSDAEYEAMLSNIREKAAAESLVGASDANADRNFSKDDINAIKNDMYARQNEEEEETQAVFIPNYDGIEDVAAELSNEIDDDDLDTTPKLRQTGVTYIPPSSSSDSENNKNQSLNINSIDDEAEDDYDEPQETDIKNNAKAINNTQQNHQVNSSNDMTMNYKKSNIPSPKRRNKPINERNGIGFFSSKLRDNKRNRI